jgi:hypothetical protein
MVEVPEVLNGRWFLQKPAWGTGAVDQYGINPILMDDEPSGLSDS